MANTNRRAACVALAATTLGLLGGCGSAPVVSDYANERPTLDLQRFFNGPMVAHGLFTDRQGRVKRRFTVKLMGRWDGRDGVLEEDFQYSDGETQRRVWRLKAVGPGLWEGRADDVVGIAVGRSAGNALNWRYTLALPVDGRTYEVQFDDWMYLMDEHTMLNKAVMSKFGVTLGEVTLSFCKP